MAETYHLRMARCSSKDIEQMRGFLFKLEELLEECDDSFEIIDFLTEYYDDNFGRHWQRLIAGYETMFENACNPNLDYLSWKPDIQEAIMAHSAQTE